MNSQLATREREREAQEKMTSDPSSRGEVLRQGEFSPTTTQERTRVSRVAREEITDELAGKKGINRQLQGRSRKQRLALFLLRKRDSRDYLNGRLCRGLLLHPGQIGLTKSTSGKRLHLMA
ncbi:hypothetical protein Acr_00g0013370 [Actinidia rufa]|uniref:Uncharacterized protein n=1 Tax=Actinidia rufa TaxID=165716 RepID=A0A7J0DAL4_9ERIC|nr:hypothetical protein Acr_00g0013370 [Actinidia rufa]